MTDRQNKIKFFLDLNGWGDAARTPLSGDASFRRYERLALDGRHSLLMDAPPPSESINNYVTIALHLKSLGFSTPNIFAKEMDLGFLIIEDFGDETFTKVLSNQDVATETDLYRLAVDVLINLHGISKDLIFPPNTTTYSIEGLIDEAQLLCDWTWGALFGSPPETAIKDAYQYAWRTSLSSLSHQFETLVLRDYHIDNLMVLKNRSGIARCGLLDFQDAVFGHRAYDLMSLLEDARRDINSGLKAAMLERYFAAFPTLERKPFAAAFAVLAAQRHSKVIGIFTRLCVRDGKKSYLKHIPRVWRLLEGALVHPSLAPVANWFDMHISQAKRIAPKL